ncbi:MAG: 16S rRNA (uracil(1498)-N(3))-methyltransferase [Bryobacterales bacterium]|nr:16S rRNA (uracil(1498)-N(3))-methyltransferase [Bryobacterales bacterium]
MARRRFFVDEIRQGQAVVSGDEAKHLRQVLRAEVGQKYELSDESRVFLAEIESFRKGEATFRVLEEISQSPLLVETTLLASLIKLDRFEWIIEKATELGVSRIIPVIAERSDYGLEKAVPKKLERWNRIALESAKQSHRVAPPKIGNLANLTEALGEAGGIRLILDEMETKPMLTALEEARAENQEDRVTLLTGPEGGWTDAERSQALTVGFASASLGPLVLRAETAAVVGLGVISASWQVK